MDIDRAAAALLQILGSNPEVVSVGHSEGVQDSFLVVYLVHHRKRLEERYKVWEGYPVRFMTTGMHLMANA